MPALSLEELEKRIRVIGCKEGKYALATRLVTSHIAGNDLNIHELRVQTATDSRPIGYLITHLSKGSTKLHHVAGVHFNKGENAKHPELSQTLERMKIG